MLGIFIVASGRSDVALKTLRSPTEYRNPPLTSCTDGANIKEAEESYRGVLACTNSTLMALKHLLHN